MDGGDGGRVETGQRITESGLARREFLGAPCEEVRHQLVLPDESRIIEGRQGVGDLAANPVP